jgi:hypothetical protein
METPTTDTPPTIEAAIEVRLAEYEEAWHHFIRTAYERLDVGFVVRTWFVAAAAAFVVTAVIAGIALLFGADFTGNTGSGIGQGAVVIASGFASFVTFFAVTLYALGVWPVRERFLNSLSVGLLQAVLAVVLAGVDGLVSLSSNNLAALALVTQQWSAISAVAACLIVPSLLPAAGPLFTGTQHGAVDEDVHL